jgi:molybdopterin molybdotransferase
MKSSMVSYSEALDLVLKHARPIGIERVELEFAHGRVLAAAVKAPSDQPGFNQAAMDGYAFRYVDLSGSGELHVSGVRKAGAIDTIKISANQAVRIFTGAAVPNGLDTVVAQELVDARNSTIRSLDNQIFKGKNIRLRGSHIQKGAVLFDCGQFLNAGAISSLASAGIIAVRVRKQPRISILVTGDELRQPGEKLQPGEVFESNGIALTCLLRESGLNPVRIIRCGDKLGELEKTIRAALKQCDLLLVTGGVSVGDYDFVPEAVKRNGLKTIFHKVRQKPAKPLLFAAGSGKHVFGLPGNPGSVITAFHTLVKPFLESVCGLKVRSARGMTSGFSYTKKAGLTHLLKARIEAGRVVLLDQQESYKVSGFAQIEGFALIEEQTTILNPGETVSFLPTSSNHQWST